MCYWSQLIQEFLGDLVLSGWALYVLLFILPTA